MMSRQRVYSISSNELREIGDYYLHNNPENFLATIKRGPLESLEKMEETIKSSMTEVMSSHINSLKKMVDKLLEKTKGNIKDRAGLVAEMKKLINDKKTEEKIVTAFNNLKIEVASVKDTKNASAKKVDKAMENMKSAIKSFLTEITNLMNQVSVKSSPFLYSMQPVAYSFAKRIGDTAIASRVEKELNKIDGSGNLVRELNKIEEKVKGVNYNTSNSELFKLTKDLKTLSEGRLKGHQNPIFLLGDEYENLFTEFVIDKSLKKIFKEDVTAKNIGTDFLHYAVADISFNFDDIKVGASLKHSTIDKTLSKPYTLPKTYSGLFGGIQIGKESHSSEDLGNIIQYVKNNLFFLKKLKGRDKYVNKLKKIETEAIKLRLVARAFDGFYKYSTNEKNFELQYYTRAGEIFNKENIKIISSVFFILQDSVFYTDEIIETLVEIINKKDNNIDGFNINLTKGGTVQTSFSKIRDVRDLKKRKGE